MLHTLLVSWTACKKKKQARWWGPGQCGLLSDLKVCGLACCREVGTWWSLGSLPTQAILILWSFSAENGVVLWHAMFLNDSPNTCSSVPEWSLQEWLQLCFTAWSSSMKLNSHAVALLSLSPKRKLWSCICYSVPCCYSSKQNYLQHSLHPFHPVSVSH